MPINLRSGADTNWGNKITLQRLTVPVAEPDPAARMRALHRAASQARAEPSLAVTGTIAGALNLLPVGYVAGILKHVDFLASNVPGAPGRSTWPAPWSPACSRSGRPSAPPSTPP